jgi:glucose-1-phosphate thymidylyltransferase
VISTRNVPSRLVGVVPAAGYATRLQPLRGSKEMHLIRGKPVMDYLIDRMERASCDEIRVVTRPEKTDVIAHAERRRLSVVTAHPSSVSESLLAGLEEADPDDVVVFGFPDTIWEPSDGFVRLVDRLEGFEVALGLFVGAEPERSDVVAFTTSGLITSIEVKPRYPTSRWIWGCAAARRRALDALVDDPEPGVVFASMCSEAAVVGVPLSESFVDIGTHEALGDYIQRTELR